MAVHLGAGIHLFGAVIRAERETLEHAAGHRIPIDNETVVLVVARLRCGRDHTVETVGHLAISDRLIGEGPADWRLAVAELVRVRVVAILEIGGHGTDPLFGLRVGQLVARSLIVIGVRDHGGHQTRQSARMDLGVGVLRQEIVAAPPGDEGLVHLYGIAVFNESGYPGKRRLVVGECGSGAEGIQEPAGPQSCTGRGGKRAEDECRPGHGLEFGEALKEVWRQVPKRPNRPTLIQENPHSPLRRIKRDRGRRGQTGRPLQKPEDTDETLRIHRETDRAAIDLNRRRCFSPCRRRFADRNESALEAHPIIDGLGRRTERVLCHHGHVFRDTDVSTGGCLRCAEIADL